MRTTIKNGILKITIFIICFFVLDSISGFYLNKLIFSAKSGVVLQEKNVLFETKEELLIFGSSRAAFHYIPSIFEEQLHMSCYNDGREGMGIFFHYAALLATLERYQPKKIILDIDFRDVYDRGGDFGESAFLGLAPYYGKVNKEFDDFISYYPYDFILYQSKIYRYNKKFFNILTANISSENDNEHGYRKLIGNWDGKEKVLEDETFNLSQNHINTIHKFINKAKENNIEVIMVFSPTHKKIDKEFFQIIDTIAKQQGIKYYNFYEEPIFQNDKSLFHDPEHLNEKGAEIFSKQMAKKISK